MVNLILILLILNVKSFKQWLFQILGLNELANGFMDFTYLTIYQLTFFVLFTTIGLNVIFGIIVDTFSELRDLKWLAEKDMRSTCFICSRDSYDFESAAQVMFVDH